MKDVSQNFLFKRVTNEENRSTNHEHFYVCEEGAIWGDVLRQFAMFLDECGYVGVYENVDMMLEERANEGAE
jgi:hypothetical protein